MGVHEGVHEGVSPSAAGFKGAQPLGLIAALV